MSSEDILDHGVLEEAVSPLVLNSGHPHSHVTRRSPIQHVGQPHGSYNSVPNSLPGTRLQNKRALANANRPPLERACSFPERGLGRAGTPGSNESNGSGGHGSRTSIDKSPVVAAIYESKDGLRERTQHNGSATASGSDNRYGSPPSYNHALQQQHHHQQHQQHHQPSSHAAYQYHRAKSTPDRTRKLYGSPDLVSSLEMLPDETSPMMRGASSRDRLSDELLTDMNNVPQIDEAITPPSSPPPTMPLQSSHATAVAALREPFHIRVAHKIAESTTRAASKRFSSLKLRRNFTLGRSVSKSMRNTRSRPRTAELDSPTSLNANPTITVTMDQDRDDDSIMSDYLNPEKNYYKDRNIHFIGDDLSLYGTPKEEPSPLKEPDVVSTSKVGSSTSYLKDQIIAFFQPSDNKLAMKLFGNKNALMKEKMRQRAAGNWVIHPCSNFR